MVKAIVYTSILGNNVKLFNIHEL